MDETTLIDKWTESTYTHPYLHTWLIVYLKKRNNNIFQDLEGLPRSMKTITEEQDRIEWANVLEGRMTKRIRDMQTMYMCNRGLTYTDDHWMRDIIKKTNGTNTRAMARAKYDKAPRYRG